MSDLLVIDVSVKSGRGHVVLAAAAHAPHSAKLVTLEFPLDALPDGSYREKEETIVRDALAVLSEARLALDER